jgi:hypothetical protein
VPRELIAIFNDHELELLISGLPDIDVGDLRANTQYSGYSPASPVIQWFWQVVADMEKQDLALLLQFVTGEAAECLWVGWVNEQWHEAVAVCAGCILVCVSASVSEVPLPEKQLRLNKPTPKGRPGPHYPSV